MIPILFDSDAQTFNTQGIGPLSDAVSCYVTEEANGAYELEMTYPVTGAHFEDIEYRSIICAIPSPYRAAQPFRVYKITRPLDGLVTIYAQHISYDLSNTVKFLPAEYAGISAALAGLKTGILGTNDFTFWTDISSNAVWSVEQPATVRNLLGGMDGSILDVYGGQYEFDGYTVKLWKSRGHDYGYAIRYGKNLTALDAEYDGSECTQALLAYYYQAATNTEARKLVYGTAKATSGPPARWRVVDVTDSYESAPTSAELDATAKTLLAQYTQEPEPSINVSFVDALDSGDVTMSGETVDLWDTVHVYYKDVLVDEKRKVTKIKTNVLLGRYEEITVGATRSDVASTISGLESSSGGGGGSSGGVLYTLSKDGTTITLTGSNGTSSSVTDSTGMTADEKTAYALKSSLATVATSGKYTDLTGRPSLATVATSGKYSDLSGTPSLAAVATSGKYSDLSGKPSLATVATSGSYGDLSDTPTIPAGWTVLWENSDASAGFGPSDTSWYSLTINGLYKYNLLYVMCQYSTTTSYGRSNIAGKMFYIPSSSDVPSFRGALEVTYSYTSGSNYALDVASRRFLIDRSGTDPQVSVMQFSTGYLFNAAGTSVKNSRGNTYCVPIYILGMTI